jgi:DNA-binding NarL/FixJ family response regulator
MQSFFHANVQKQAPSLPLVTEITRLLPLAAPCYKHCPMPIRVIIADDFDAVRRTLRNLLKSAGDIELIGEAADYAETLRLVSELDPDVLVMDLHMPVPNRMTTTDIGRVMSQSPCRIVAISVWVDELAQEIAQALGAVARLDKSELPRTLIPAIRTAAASRTTVHQSRSSE